MPFRVLVCPLVKLVRARAAAAHITIRNATRHAARARRWPARGALKRKAQRACIGVPSTWFYGSYVLPKYPQLRKNARACRARTLLKALSNATPISTVLKSRSCCCKYRLTQPKAPLSSGVQSKQ